MKKRFFLVLLFPIVSFGQSSNATLNDDYYHWITRYEIKAGRVATEIFTTVKPFRRSNIIEFIDTLNKRDNAFSSEADKFNYEYLRNDSWEWSRSENNVSKKPFLKNLYSNKSDLVFVDEPSFDLHVSPVLYLGMGKDNRVSEPLMINTRGVEVRGTIDKKIAFYTFLTDNQAILPGYVHDQMKLNPIVPHEGFWKNFKTNGVDFFQARAYVDFNISKHINFQFGNDRTFIGNGYRSLILSDYSSPNLFLRVNAKVWKLNYLFQLNRLTADQPASIGPNGFPVGSTANVRYPQKFMSFHHLSMNIGKKFNLGIFETIIFAPNDSLNKSTFELGYLNPIIFLRATEQQFGSTDNAVVGADFKWNAMKKISFYGQVVIDEFVLKELQAGKGWWANKFGVQGGIKYIDAFNVPNLDIQLEGNLVRPYTYSHDTQYSNYSNYRQALAHPLGANFMEAVAIVRYQPLPKLNLTAKTFFAKIGRDTTGVNWGSDIMKNNISRKQDYGNFIGQGIKNTIAFVDIRASYMVRHNFFIEISQTIRQSSSPVAFYNNNTSITSLAIRWNIPLRTYDF